MDFEKASRFKAPIVRMERITKVYGARLALENFHLLIEASECVALLGPNGAGKTTALHVLCGFIRPTEGKVSILGVDLQQNPRLAKASLGVAPQADSLDTELGVLENLITYASYYGIPRKEASKSALEWLEFLGLTAYAKEPIDALSGGMRRRLLIARALVHNPKVLILDEPTTGLDPFSRRDTWEAISRIKALGVCILLTTHYLEEANILADRAIILDKGRKIAEGSPETLVMHYTGELVIELVAPKGRVKELFDGVPLPKGQKEIVADTVRLYLKEGLKDGLKGWLEGLKSVRIFKREPTLEDVYFKLLGNGQKKVL
jgi:lipooligosaccharide transport system ATP-binding protein